MKAGVFLTIIAAIFMVACGEECSNTNSATYVNDATINMPADLTNDQVIINSLDDFDGYVQNYESRFSVYYESWIPNDLIKEDANPPANNWIGFNHSGAITFDVSGIQWEKVKDITVSLFPLEFYPCYITEFPTSIILQLEDFTDDDYNSWNTCKNCIEYQRYIRHPDFGKIANMPSFPLTRDGANWHSASLLDAVPILKGRSKITFIISQTKCTYYIKT